MENIPIINPPSIDDKHNHWCYQFTVPLLFDDCLSLLQKVCAMWAKVNDVIDALSRWNDEFTLWASNIENEIEDLYEKYTSLEHRITKVETDIATINETLYNLGQRILIIENALTNINTRLDNIVNNISTIEQEISNIKDDINSINIIIGGIQTDLLALESRVTKLEELLKNLNIIPPVDIYNESDEAFASGLWVNWWDWMKVHVQFTDRLPASGWEYSANVIWWDTSTHLPRYFQLGRLAQPVTLCKLPFVAVYKNAFDSLPSLSTLATIVPYFKESAFTAGNGFFDFPLTKEFGATMDEVKFQTSYIPFLPEQSILFTSWNSGSVGVVKNINCGVRVQVPESGTNAKLCVCTNQLIMAVCPHSVPVTSDTHWDIYIYAVAENG